jgi:general secretion pathway protein N
MAVIRVTPLSGILFALSVVLAAGAAAGPIDQPAGPTPEVDAAPAAAAKGTGVPDAADSAGVPFASDRRQASPAGNPLWTIPLTALAATRDRPLFSASRRPPVVPVPIVAAPPPQKEEALAPPPPERPLLTLIGTIVSPQASVAMLQGSNAEAISRLRVGQENDGWQVRGIDLRSIVVVKGGQSVKLDLPRPDGAAAE